MGKPAFDPKKSYEEAKSAEAKPKFNYAKPVDEILDESPKLSAEDTQAAATGGTVSPEGQAILDAQAAKVMGPLSVAADLAGRTLDYPAGITRAGLAQVAGVGQEGDFENALKAKPASSSEYLGRAGMEPGFKKEALGFGLDVASDPLNYLTFGGAGVLRKALQKSTAASAAKAGGLMEKLGKKIYTAGSLGKIDQAVAKTGAKPVSDLLYQKNIWGTASSIEKQARELGNDLYKAREEIIQRAKGVPVDTSEIDNAISNLENEWTAQGSAHAKNPARAQALEEAKAIKEKWFGALEAKPEASMASEVPTGLVDEAGAPITRTESSVVPAQEAGDLGQLSSNLTSFTRQEMTPKAFGLAPSTDELMQALKKLRHAGKTAAEATAEKIGEGAAYSKANEGMSSLMAAKDAMAAEGKKTLSTPVVGAIGGGLMGAAKTGGNIGAAVGFGLGKLSRAAVAQTPVGLLVGKSGQMIKEALKSESAWNRMVATPAGQRALVELLKANGQ